MGPPVIQAPDVEAAEMIEDEEGALPPAVNARPEVAPGPEPMLSRRG
jgi:hypothetical protein